MNLPNEINKYWNYLEEKYPSPRYVKKVKKLNFSKLKKEIDNKNYKYIKKLIRKMFVEKEAYILKNSADKNLKNTIIQLANYYKKNKKTSFYKMIDGVPNFHRVIDKNITKNIVYLPLNIIYFYNWNIKTKLEKKRRWVTCIGDM